MEAAPRHPRMQVAVVLALAGIGAFLCSFGLLSAGFLSMPWRYPIVALAGYGLFLVLIRTWVTWGGGQLRSLVDLDLPDDVSLPTNLFSASQQSATTTGRAANALFSGGRSGGGGAASGWTSHTASAVRPAGGSTGGSWLSIDLDGDDIFWLIVALAAAFSGLCAIGYVIYVAPALLADAAVHAAVVSGAYHGVKRREAAHWQTAVVRRTWIPASVLVVSAALAGYALHRVAPEAQSIGGVVSHVAGSGR